MRVCFLLQPKAEAMILNVCRVCVRQNPGMFNRGVLVVESVL